jgi:predicted RecA/RadA family phage recombinase
MATNVKFAEGNNLSLPVPDGTLSGAPVRVGSLNGVAMTKEGEGGNADNYASVQLEGVFNLTVTGAVSNVGDPVYIAAGALNVTNTNPLFGHALATKGAAAGVIPVRIAN